LSLRFSSGWLPIAATLAFFGKQTLKPLALGFVLLFCKQLTIVCDL